MNTKKSWAVPMLCSVYKILAHKHYTLSWRGPGSPYINISQWRKITSALLIFLCQSAISNVIYVNDTLFSRPINEALETAVADRGRKLPASHWLNSNKFSTDLYRESQISSPKTYWHRIRIRADISRTQNYYLMVENPIIQELSLFIFDGSQLLQRNELGLGNIPDDERYKGKYIRFSLSPGQQLTLLIRKRSESPTIMPIALYSEEGFENSQAIQNMFWGAVIAVLAVVAIYNFFISVMTKSLSHEWYMLFYVLSFFYFSAAHGYGYLLWPAGLQIALTENLLLLNFVLLWVLILFSRQFLVIKENATWHFRQHRKIMYCAPAGAALTPFVPEYIFMHVFFIYLLAVAGFLISMAWVSYRNGFRPARFYLVSWIAVLSGTIAATTSFLGLLPYNFYTIHGFLLSTVVELILLSVALADKLRFAEEAVLSQAYIDPRSGLPNYSYFRQRFPIVLKELAQSEKDISMLMIKPLGLDYIINLLGPDRLGRVYRELARCLQSYLESTSWSISIDLPNGKSSYMFALHGNQFLLLSRQSQNVDLIAAEFLKNTTQMFAIDNLVTHLSFQMGIARYDNGITVTDCYRRAQLALLECGSSDANWQNYTKEHDRQILENLELIADLRNAIANNELAMVMQPQFDSANKLMGAEALVRWRHPQKGMISPALFIPLAEQTHQVFDITRHILGTACEWLKNEGRGLNNFRLSINLSALDINEPTLLQTIEQCIQATNVSPHSITFELTETAMRKTPAQFVETICALQKLGFHIALDDFGTGYSSMAYIQQINADEIKIDIAFVRSIEKSEINRKIIRAIVQLAHSTDAYTIAEGVETEDEMKVLKSLGVDYFQGYLLERPIAPDEFYLKYVATTATQKEEIKLVGGAQHNYPRLH